MNLPVGIVWSSKRPGSSSIPLRNLKFRPPHALRFYHCSVAQEKVPTTA